MVNETNLAEDKNPLKSVEVSSYSFHQPLVQGRYGKYINKFLFTYTKIIPFLLITTVSLFFIGYIFYRESAFVIILFLIIITAIIVDIYYILLVFILILNSNNKLIHFLVLFCTIVLVPSVILSFPLLAMIIIFGQLWSIKTLVKENSNRITDLMRTILYLFPLIVIANVFVFLFFAFIGG